jgi:hypothetical protein
MWMMPNEGHKVAAVVSLNAIGRLTDEQERFNMFLCIITASKTSNVNKKFITF